MKNNKIVHSFQQQEISNINLPERMNNPFFYKPHPLCIIAAQKIISYINSDTKWNDAFSQGKMLGVLIVKDNNGEIYYLAAYSGNLLFKEHNNFFVPPIYDLSHPLNFYKKEEEYITTLNKKILNIEEDPYLKSIQSMRLEKEIEMNQTLKAFKQKLIEAKSIRDQKRYYGVDKKTELDLIKESQFLKAEYNRIKKRYEKEVMIIKLEEESLTQKITDLKQERKRCSHSLQQKIFEHFIIHNRLSQRNNLLEIFSQSPIKTPPSGAGECAAPKLLQYAFTHQLTPISISEFWYGKTPHSEPRKHGQFYSSCLDKCAPILSFMLKGIKINYPQPRLLSNKDIKKINILYEDNSLIVVNKPIGVLSTKGKENSLTICDLIKSTSPSRSFLIPVHRLDMDTSGLLVIAKTINAYEFLQKQFTERRVIKKYIAKLEKEIITHQGIISLPICPNPSIRPYQNVDYSFGKVAITRYKVIEKHKGETLISFTPLTGRTHQLRVHSSHIRGLNSPIVGESLYSYKINDIYNSRLMLHAETIQFNHPETNQIMNFCVPINW